MGFHQGLASEQYDRQYSNKVLFDRIMSYARPYKRQVILIIILVVVAGINGSLSPLLVSNILDSSAENAPTTNVYWLLTLGVLALEVMGYVYYHFKHKLKTRVIADMIRDLASDAFAASMKQDLAFHDKFSSGKIVSRITTDTRDFSSLMSLTMDVISSLLQSLAIAFILLRTEWRLALAIFMVVPILIGMVTWYRHKARAVTRDGMRAMATVNATIKETISGISIAKNFRQEEAIYDEFTESNISSYQVNIRRGLILSVVFPTVRTFGGIVIALLTYFGSRSVIDGFITAGAWYLFILSADRFLMPIMSMTSYWTQLQTGLSAAERVFALIDAEHSVQQTDDKVPQEMKGEIVFENVDFHYTPDAPILSNFNLRIAPGENLAIVGHTGSGKSSIARLLTRFYEYQGGKILIDGQDIRSFDLTALRGRIGLVTQVPFLFEGTVEENIRLSRPEVTTEEILAIARQIGNGEWLETFSQGLATEVGERGSKISMGQRQLVALMRVLVQQPSFFILDEATASIDPFTEKQIQNALSLILDRTTSVLIAHRLSTVQSADRIIVLDHGVILEEGDHAGLLDKGGHYATLYNTYFRHQSLAYVEDSGRWFGREADSPPAAAAESL